jgi:hypothetical protein
MQYRRLVLIAMVALGAGCKASQPDSSSEGDGIAATAVPPQVTEDTGMPAPPVAQPPPPTEVHVDHHVDASVSHGAGTHSHHDRDEDAGDDAVAAQDAAPPVDAALPPSDKTVAVIVAAGADHTLAISIDDGVTFCQVKREVPANIGDGYDNLNLFRHVSYANGRFVAGSATKVFASVNGYAWEDVTGGDRPALGTYVAEIDYGNGYWVGVGASGTVMRSTDLAHWERVNANWPASNARSLVFGDGRFVASRDSGGWWSSTDGSTWQAFDTSQHGGVVFDDGRFMPDPGYRRGHGIRLRATFQDKSIERAEDRDDAPYTKVATLQDVISDFAFGDAPAEDFAPGKVMPVELADCLGR